MAMWLQQDTRSCSVAVQMGLAAALDKSSAAVVRLGGGPCARGLARCLCGLGIEISRIQEGAIDKPPLRMTVTFGPAWLGLEKNASEPGQGYLDEVVALKTPLF
ncbi:uncharacterized protein PGTG_22675 [Puccinia graminis f. sp. tritici CRL 75-36-700-3]|uniref:Uncharacterized protein n=1 Tax=Puccinia graminis f. sp. tritici (strain CRL 75-36-700-3 / race SCCL) TaxID=418459 RepID=H6QV83_PUCGT|nr:uncharacterized protein PGTG_22675 [Puccinia graminis f. sp. tritici CRL 75-36-700-3]EHS62784.1 hypothetical protein PGTG_22675 [Puccinia graminis f. sp. tritici CRL 75-36-700-3]